MIKVTYSTIDRFRRTKTFKTLAGARKFAQHWVGATPEIGSTYAVSGDGVGKVTVEGASLKDLFGQDDERITKVDAQFWHDQHGFPEYGMVWVVTANGNVYGVETRKGETEAGLVERYKKQGWIDDRCTLFRAKGEY